jgi:peptidyl-prolyl cis-trans isomerase C
MKRVMVLMVSGLCMLSTAYAQEKSMDDAVVVTHASGVTITEQELAQEIDYIQSTKALTQVPPIDVLENLSLQLLVTKLMRNDAEQLKLDSDPAVQYELERSKMMILANARLKALEKVDFDDEVVAQLGKEYYFGHEDEFTDPEQRKLSHILIRVNKDNKMERRILADQLMQELKDNPDRFEEIAREKSDDKGSGEKGGQLGWATKDRFVAPFSKAGFAIEKVGDLVGPIETQFGFHIIRLDDLKKSHLKPYAEVKQEAEEKAKQAFIQDRKAKYVNSLRASGDREIHKDVLQGYLNELTKESEKKDSAQ